MKSISIVRVLLGMVMACICLASSSSYAEVKPGDVIDESNWQGATEYLPPSIIEMLKTHGLVINVGEQKEYPLNPQYMEATKKYAGTLKLEDNLANYKAGCPFPDIDPKDPDAGLKIAWNYQYRCQPEQRIFTESKFVWVNKNGEIEREAHLIDRLLYFVGRTTVPPVPEYPDRGGVIYKEMLHMWSPKDLAGVGFLAIRYQSEDRDDDSWAYVPALRRVRRMSAAMRTDAYLGSDIAIEDFYGFSGKVSEFDWKVVGRKKILAIRDSEREPSPTGGNKYKWCPAGIPWQLRDTWIVESVPNVTGHPYSKRVLYIDAQWYDVLYSEIYDQGGKFWKLWIQPWYWWPDLNWFTFPSCSMIDFQALHATVVPTKCNPKGEYGPEAFTINALESLGH